MLLITSLLLALSAQAIAQASDTISAPAAISTGYDESGQSCDNWSAYDACVYPLVTCPVDPPAVHSSCGCAQAKRDISCWTSNCPSNPTAADLFIYLIASSILCDGLPLLPTGLTVTGLVVSTPTQSSTLETSSGSKATTGAVAKTGSSSSTATVATTTSKGSAERGMGMGGSASLVGGVLGGVVGFVGWFL